ncbi:MAG: hypothetical protein ACRC10_07025 [Thermoguttaceae bacterium]
MHLTVELGYNEVLRLVRQLSDFDQQRLTQELGGNQRTTTATSQSVLAVAQSSLSEQETFHQFLLTFPVLDEDSINKMLSAKEEVDQCHPMSL